MKWKNPPIIKIYEALGSVADGRVEISGNSAKVYSSSGNKSYEVKYDPESKAIMANDNGSYWKGYLGYPAIAFLMKNGVVSFDPKIAQMLKGVPWKDINQKFKNDFEKTLDYILTPKSADEKRMLEELVSKVDADIRALGLTHLGKRVAPPQGY